MSWPPSTDGLAFRWENGSESNTIPSDGPVDQLCRLIPSGQAKFNRFWAMDVADGAYRAEPVMNTSILERLRESNQLTLEVTVTTSSNSGSGLGHIVSYGRDSRDWSLVLAQRADALVFGIESSASGQLPLMEVGRLVEGRPHHVVVTVADDAVIGYIDGQPVSSHDIDQIDVSAWAERRLSFGQASDGSSDWAGTIEGVALYDRALSADEVGRHHQAYAPRLEGRAALPQLEVEARLTEKRDVPRASLYPNTLVVFDYRVNAVNLGSYDEEKILVTHWGNLNGERQTTTQDLQVGRSYRLRLEPFDAHPELVAIRLVMNEEDFHLPMYYAVSAPVRE